MRRTYRLLETMLLTIVLGASSSAVAQSQNTQSHTDWITSSLKEMQTIKVGMTRADLLKVFKEEGGLSNRRNRRYVYRDCPYIKVDVEFEPMEAKADWGEHRSDKITKISKPFLEWSIMD